MNDAEKIYKDAQERIIKARGEIAKLEKDYENLFKEASAPLREEIKNLQKIAKPSLKEARREACLDMMLDILRTTEREWSKMRNPSWWMVHGVFDFPKENRSYRKPSAEVKISESTNVGNKIYTVNFQLGTEGMQKLSKASVDFPDLQSAIDGWHQVAQEACAKYLKRSAPEKLSEL